LFFTIQVELECGDMAVDMEYVQLNLLPIMAKINRDQGRVYIRGFPLDVEDVRRLYYGVLGIKMPPTTIKQEVAEQTITGHISVDVPEDILKVEKVIKAIEEKKANGAI